MRRRRRRRRITQRHDGHPVNPPSLQVVMCTKQKNKKNKIKWELKKYFVVLLGLPDVLLNGSWVGRAIVGQQTKIRHLIIGMFFFLSCCLFYVYFNSTYHLDIFLYLYVLTETVLFTLFLQQVSESFFKRDVWNIRLCDSLYEKKKYLSEKESVSVYRQPIWQMWCSLSPSDTNPSFYYLYKMTSK